jgi:hypothetical protein
MGLNIRLYGINSPKAFTLSYKTGKTAGDESVIATGYTSYGSLYPNSSSRDYNANPIIFTDASFDTQYWFKLTYTGDTGDVNYVIENIFTNEAEVYDNCINYCYFPNVGSAVYIAPTPTPSPTPSPTPNCDFSGGSATVVIGPTPTPNPTATPTPTATTVVPTPTPTPTSTTVVPTSTPTPTPTSTQLVGQCYTINVSTTVNQNNYGIRYTDPNIGASQDVKFNMLPSVDAGSYSTFYICSTVDPTLLDYTGGFAIGVGSIAGVTKLGPNGICSASLDCSTLIQYCYYNSVQQQTIGPFNTQQECQAAAGSYICSQCVT